MHPPRIALLILLSAGLSGCSGIRDVQTFSYAGGQIRGGPIGYDHLPPAGGPYSPLWQACGVYARPVYPEYAVHSLARGAVWLTYRPTLSPADIDTLKAAIKDQPGAMLSPLDNQQPAVMLSAWNAQLALKSVNDSRLKRFIREYSGARGVPEAGKGCAGGQSATWE